MVHVSATRCRIATRALNSLIWIKVAGADGYNPTMAKPIAATPLRWPLALALISYALAASAQVEITGAWVRASVPGQRTAGAFMQLKSATEARLVAVSSPVAKVVEIHEMKLDSGVMKMRAIDKLDLPAGKPVTLAPGGYHVMLMGVAQPLKEGDSVPLTLTIEDKSGKRQQVAVQARVRGLTAPK